MTAATKESPPEGPRLKPLALWGAIVLIHLGLLVHFAPPEVIFSEDPVSDIDFPLHYYQVDRAQKAWSGWGRLWGYDPLQLAGHPVGTLEDLSSKSIELFAIALGELGIGTGMAFNLYILLIHLLVPFVGYGAARLFRLSRYQAAAVSFLWVLLWFFDSFLHWLWFCGMVSWAGSSYLIVLLVGLLYRCFDDDRLGIWIAVGLLASLLALVHPYATLTLLAPCLGLYLRDLRRARWPHHLALGISLCAVAATASIWMVPAMQAIHYLIEESHFLHPSLSYILWDYLDLLVDDLQTGPPVRTMLRVLAFACGAVCLWRWRREGDRRFLPFLLLLAVALFWAYLGGYLPYIKMSQPYRHIGPAILAAAIPAVVLLSDLLDLGRLRALSRPVKLLLLLGLLLVIPRFAHNVLFYFPEALPENPRPVGPLDPRPPWSSLAGFVIHGPFPLRHHPPPRVWKEVRQWLEENLDGKGRVAIQQSMLGEYIAASSNLPLLSGLEQRSIYHGDAHLFRLSKDGNLPGDALREYLERYAVRYVVVAEVKPQLEWRRDILVFRKLIGMVRIYETRIRPSYFLRGRGRITEQAFNRIVVQDAAGPEVVLRFHFLETLRCRPGCRVEQVDVKGDRVGFIRVPNPPRRFEIYNSYRFDGPRWRPPRPEPKKGSAS